MMVFFAPSRKSSNTTEYEGMKYPFYHWRRGVCLPAPWFPDRESFPNQALASTRPYPGYENGHQRTKTCSRPYASSLHDTNLGLLIIPHLPLLVDRLQRAIFLENIESLIDLRQKFLCIGIALFKTTIVIVGINRLSKQL